MYSLSRSALAAFALAAAGFELPSHAVTDPAGDFLATHTGVAAPDIDILSVDIFDFGPGIVFSAVMNGPLGQTAGASYVFGVDRGAGVAGLFSGAPPVGPGVTFDAVVVLRADGTGTVTAFNEVGGPTVTQIGESVFIDSNAVFAHVDAALLPTRGFAQADYRFNLWTRSSGGNVGIADLGQEQGTFGYSTLPGAVPEPASWALLISGFGLVGAMARRRRPCAVSA